MHSTALRGSGGRGVEGAPVRRSRGSDPGATTRTSGPGAPETDLSESSQGPQSAGLSSLPPGGAGSVLDAGSSALGEASRGSLGVDPGERSSQRRPGLGAVWTVLQDRHNTVKSAGLCARCGDPLSKGERFWFLRQASGLLGQGCRICYQEVRGTRFAGYSAPQAVKHSDQDRPATFLGVGLEGNGGLTVGATVAPPVCLTGVQTPDCQTGDSQNKSNSGQDQSDSDQNRSDSDPHPVTCAIDYLRFTVPDEVPVETVRSLFGTVEWMERPKGALGYSRACEWEGILLLFEGRVGMGTHVEMSGRACRVWEGSERFRAVGGWVPFLTTLMDLGAKSSRWDVAWDDRNDGDEGFLSMPELREAIEQRAFTTRWRSWGDNREWVVREGVETLQEKVTFGRRGSETYLRIYDKAAQQGESGHWLRCELEFRDDRATQAIQEFLAFGLAHIAGVLRGCLEFKQADTATRRERWLPAEWWIRFLDHAEKAQLCLNPLIRTLRRSLDWLDAQVCSTLAFVLLAAGPGALDELLDLGAMRLQAWQARILRKMGRISDKPPRMTPRLTPV